MHDTWYCRKLKIVVAVADTFVAMLVTQKLDDKAKVTARDCFQTVTK